MPQKANETAKNPLLQAQKRGPHVQAGKEEKKNAHRFYAPFSVH